MRPIFQMILAGGLLILFSVADLPVFAQIRMTESETAYVPQGTGGYNIPQYRSHAEFTLDMLLRRGDNRLLGSQIDPLEYPVGPGDRFGIFFVSGDISNISCEIGIGGTLFIKSVGSINLRGDNLQEALEKIRTAVRRNYSGSEFDVQLTEFRFVRILVIGEVVNPGIYYAPAVWRVSEVIELAGGLAPEASPRAVRLLSDGQESPVDLVRFAAIGDVGVNPLIGRGETIRVPKRQLTDNYISVFGLVNSPVVFTAIEGDHLGDIISYAHGPAGDLGNMMILVCSPAGDVIISLDGADAASLDYLPSSGNNITLTWKEGKHIIGAVTIFGEITRPGRYVIPREQFSLQDLMALCGGVTTMGYPEMIQIYRKTETELPDGLQILTGNPVSADAPLNAVFGRNEEQGRSLISYDPRHPLDYSQLLLINGDSLYVPRATGTITVTGAVASPGLIRFQPGEGVDYYLGQAGGLGYDADRERMAVINPITGSGIDASRAGELFDSEILFVPRKWYGTQP